MLYLALCCELRAQHECLIRPGKTRRRNVSHGTAFPLDLGLSSHQQDKVALRSLMGDESRETWTSRSADRRATNCANGPRHVQNTSDIARTQGKTQKCAL